MISNIKLINCLNTLKMFDVNVCKRLSRLKNTLCQIIWPYTCILYVEIWSMPSCSTLGFTNRSEKITLFNSIQYHLIEATRNFAWNRYKGWSKLETYHRMDDSYFNESCFERDLEIVILLLLCRFKFHWCLF